MNTQPAALHYAEVLENFYLGLGRIDATGAAAELRRLHELNQELVEVAKRGLKESESWVKDQLEGTRDYKTAMAELEPIRAAISKATGGAA